VVWKKFAKVYIWHRGDGPTAVPHGGTKARSTVALLPRGGPICIHGYSVEYPKFLTKEVHIHSILHVCVIKIEKRHYTLGFHCSIRPPQRPLPVAGPKFSRPNPPAHTFFGLDRFAQQLAAQPNSHQPPDSAPNGLLQRRRPHEHGAGTANPSGGRSTVGPTTGWAQAETCRPVPHLSRAGGGDGAAAGLQRSHGEEHRSGSVPSGAGGRRLRAQDQPRVASTTTSPPSSILPQFLFDWSFWKKWTQITSDCNFDWRLLVNLW
jgi:hypothetical protein